MWVMKIKKICIVMLRKINYKRNLVGWGGIYWNNSIGPLEIYKFSIISNIVQINSKIIIIYKINIISLFISLCIHKNSNNFNSNINININMKNNKIIKLNIIVFINSKKISV